MPRDNYRGEYIVFSLKKKKLKNCAGSGRRMGEVKWKPPSHSDFAMVLKAVYYYSSSNVREYKHRVFYRWSSRYFAFTTLSIFDDFIMSLQVIDEIEYL